MRKPKITRDELLVRCSNKFRKYGFHGTTMDMLASACDLTKATFYHHYSNKEELMKDVLLWTHEKIKHNLFSIAYDEKLEPDIRLELMGKKSKKLFQEDSIGCLMGVVAIDAAYTKADLMAPIRDFLDDWALALSHVFAIKFGEIEAKQIARQLVAEYEGAILMARIYNDATMIEKVTEKALMKLNSVAA
ncbi:TetR/AcrR family transcriptional regulator [Acinetobacter johnsonii]|uniref:TetR/AcrR family transcriptional regulator n=1 Tax=Acinetobacter johnsonii TaxID=40214 RepID=UPI003F54CCC1